MQGPDRQDPPVDSSEKQVRTTVRLPEDLADVVRNRARIMGITTAEVILNAFLSKQAALDSRYDNKKNRDRIALGLQPETDHELYDRRKTSVQLGLSLTSTAHHQLKSRAVELRMPVRRYVAELLQLHLSDIGTIHQSDC